MKFSQHQQGFAAVEALLIVIVLAIVGGTGWFVLHSKQSADKALSTVAAPATQSTVKKATTPTSSTSADTKKYLVIKEWGVKIPLSAGTADAVYAISPANGQQYARAALSTTMLTNMDAGCGVTGTPPGELVRQTMADHDANAAKGDSTIDNPVFQQKVGNYYYQFMSAQGVCSQNDSANQAQLAATQAFHDEIANLQLAN